MSKIERAQFRAVCKGGKLLFTNVTDLERYSLENEGQLITVLCNVTNTKADKERMINFLHGPIAYCASIGYRKQGFEFTDDVVAIYMLQAELAKEFILNKQTGEQVPCVISISSMTKQRLHQFISDCLFYMETNLQVETPDSASYKLNMNTERNYTRVKNINDNGEAAEKATAT